MLFHVGTDTLDVGIDLSLRSECFCRENQLPVKRLDDFLFRLRLRFWLRQRRGSFYHGRMEDGIDAADGIVLELPDLRNKTVQQ